MGRRPIDENNPNTYVTCHLCGMKARTVSTAHLKTHNTTREEYKRAYPNSPLRSVESQRKRSEISKTVCIKALQKKLGGKEGMRKNIERARQKIGKRTEEWNQKIYESRWKKGRRKGDRGLLRKLKKKAAEEHTRREQDSFKDSSRIDPNDQDTFVICQLCGKKKGQLTQHLHRHGYTIEQYKEEFPGTELMCKKLREMHSKVGNKQAERLSSQWTEEKRKEQAGIMRKWHKEHPEVAKAQSKRLAGCTLDETHKRRISVASKKYWQNPNPDHKDNIVYNRNNNPIAYTNKNGVRKVMSGTWEPKFAIYLDLLTLGWEYEAFVFAYHFEGKIKNYYPDFYIPYFDLFVEITGWKSKTKPYKRQAVVDAGEDYIVLKEQDINLLSFIPLEPEPKETRQWRVNNNEPREVLFMDFQHIHPNFGLLKEIEKILK